MLTLKGLRPDWPLADHQLLPFSSDRILHRQRSGRVFPGGVAKFDWLDQKTRQSLLDPSGMDSGTLPGQVPRRQSEHTLLSCGCGNFRSLLCREAAAYYCAIRIAYLGCCRMSALSPQLKWGRKLRRSKRLGLAFRVCVYGQDAFRDRFREFTHMLSVNAHGGLIALAALVEEGQTILVENRNTREEREFRVVDVCPAREGKWRVGVEFAQRSTNFWRIHFPPIHEHRRHAD
jgi:hypothetical protein